MTIRPQLRSCDTVAAQAHFSDLLEQAQHGVTTIITQHGKPMAALVPITASDDSPRLLLASMKASGPGLWNAPVHVAIDRIRTEWD